MDKYYHFTNINSFNSIMNQGLIPQTGFRCQSIGDDSFGVFLSKGVDKSIIMFAYMLSYFNKLRGQEGADVIKELYEENQMLMQPTKTRIERNINDNVIKNNFNRINTIMYVRNCVDFTSYLGGLGCLLSIDGLSNINDVVPENCCYNGIITPDKISVVNLRNKYTNDYYYLLYPVLSYFMYMYPVDVVTKYVDESNKEMIYNLYKERDMSCFVGFNLDNFEAIEIPISFYNQNVLKIKTLTN